ncbi:DUF4031 domain-containing protein [Hyphomonas sp.]|uniref:DUF4031 domain-containing protein n=1 Tax=Hyphomonas sp. TaxID=87 RepID=UPI0025BB54D6|nr:DUF4031 domain-containing protein [Hyphomonas sp.]
MPDNAPILVDALRLHDGKSWCHMVCSDLATLDAFAAEIGVTSYRQMPPKVKFPHYDLTPAARDRAIAAGAVESDRGDVIAAAHHARRSYELARAQKALPLGGRR